MSTTPQKEKIEKIVHKIFIQEDLMGGAKDIELLVSEALQQEREKLQALKKLKFKYGERPWCIECLDRIIKRVEE